jgi:hypothetical protein
MTPPDVMKKGPEDVLEDIRRRALLYTPDWQGGRTEEDPAAALAAIMAQFASVMVKRLNQAPERHFLSFLEMVNTLRLPACPARVPLTFVPSKGAPDPVTVPAATRASAEGSDGNPVIFETGKTFLAAPALLCEAFTMDRASDHIRDLRGVLDGSGPGILFDPPAPNRQDHSLYIGDRKVLSVKEGIIQITLRGRNLGELAGSQVTWYRGTGTGDQVAWKEFPKPRSAGPVKLADGMTSELQVYLDVKGPIDPVKLNGTESCWIRCQAVPGTAAERLWKVEIGEVVLGCSPPAKGSLPVEKVQGIGEIFLGRLAGPGVMDPVTTVEELLGFTAEDLARRLRCTRTRAVNILEAATKAYYDKTGGEYAVTPVEGIAPDLLFCNDVPVEVPGPGVLYPFGMKPRLYDTLSIASDDAFSKEGYKVTLELLLTRGKPGTAVRPPRLSWEYWDGEGWAALGIEEDLVDGTAECPSPAIPIIPPVKVIKWESVTISPLPAVQPTMVNGKKHRWIRVRLVEGDYGAEVRMTGKNTVEPGSFCPPEIHGLRLRYSGDGKPPEHLCTLNNLDFRVLLRPGRPLPTGGFHPFEPIPDALPALYLGFDRPLAGGPFSFYLATNPAAEAPGDARGRVRWHYSRGALPWGELEVLDGTEGLARAGMVQYLVPGGHEGTGILGSTGDRYWIRALVEEPAPAALHVTGIYHNTTWAVQSRTVPGEIIGSGSGEAGQVVKLQYTPVTEAQVSVNEAPILSPDEQDALRREHPRIPERADQSGVVTEFWVPWAPVPDFLGSGPRDRHYLIDPATGEVTFGDGVQGMVPPPGRNNLRADYRTGGGAAGNLPARAVAKLHSSVPFIDKVYNPVSSGGGSDIEEIEDLIARGPSALKHRGRAVTPWDYEQIARDASREVARARVFPATDEAMAPCPGRVTVAIVPRSSDARPRPSPQLRHLVKGYLADRSPNVARISIIPPAYVAVDVTAVILARKMDAVPLIEQAAAAGIRGFLHPLTGGQGGGGWAFGQTPCLADLYSLLEGIDGVEYVRELSFSLSAGDPAAITRGECTGQGEIASFALPCSGNHRITVLPDPEGRP